MPTQAQNDMIRIDRFLCTGSASEAASDHGLCFDVADIALGLIVAERNTELF